jgi:hypothetical protein
VRKAWALGVVAGFIVAGWGCGGEGRASFRRIDSGTGDGGLLADAGFDGGIPDGGPDAGMADGGVSDAGQDGGMADGGVSDAGQDGGTADGGSDGGSADAGSLGRWQPLGLPLGRDAQTYPVLTLDPSGVIYLAFAALAEGPGMDQTELRVWRWSGRSWTPVGDVVVSSVLRFPSSAPLWLGLATDATGHPLVAFGDSGPDSGTGMFPLKTWKLDGGVWESVPVPRAAAFLNGLALVRGADGSVRLAVAADGQLQLWGLGPTGWTEVASPLPAPADAGVSQPDLALSGDGTAVVVFDTALVAGEVGALRAARWTDGGWADLGLPSPGDAGTVFYGPRVQLRSDGGVVVAAAQWLREEQSHLQDGVAVPILSLGLGGWATAAIATPPGGSGLSEPVVGAPLGLALRNDTPIVVFTDRDGGTELHALTAGGLDVALAPTLEGVMAGTLVLDSMGVSVVGGVTPLVILDAGLPAVDGGASEVLRVLPP